jgi:hypothetical protein
MSCLDAISSGDALRQPQLNLLGTLQDTGTFSALSSTIGSFGSAIEQIVIAADFSGPMISYLSVSETTTISQIIDALALFPRGATDSVFISDIPSGIRVLFRSIQDALALADSNTSQVIFAPTALDGIVTEDITGGSLFITLPVADKLILSEVLSGVCIYATQLTDGIKAGSSSSGPITIMVPISEGISLSETVASLCSFTASLTDSMSISDTFMRWDPDGIVFLSFTADSRIFNIVALNRQFSFQASHKHLSFTANPGREP